MSLFLSFQKQKKKRKKIMISFIFSFIKMFIVGLRGYQPLLVALKQYYDSFIHNLLRQYLVISTISYHIYYIVMKINFEKGQSLKVMQQSQRALGLCGTTNALVCFEKQISVHRRNHLLLVLKFLCKNKINQYALQKSLTPSFKVLV